jgi:hypothetical protein
MKMLAIVVLLAASAALAQEQTYCTNVADNFVCTSYNNATSSQTYCSQIGGNLSCTTYDSDNTTQVRIQRNYEAGQIIGTSLGTIIVAAIQKHQAKTQAQKDWDQFVQDQFSQSELACETNPEMGGATACRTFYFAINSFIHKHRKDCFPCKENFELFAEAADRIFPADFTLQQTTEQTVEAMFQAVDKKQLRKR